MSIEDMDDLGPQNDGEPAVVAEVVPEVVEETKPEPEATKPEGEEQEEGEEERPHKKSGSQRAREKAMRLEVENEMLRAQLAGAKTSEPVAPKPEGKPSIDQFDSIEAFTEALTDWKVDHRLAETAQKTAADKTVQTWEGIKSKGLEKFGEDYQDALDNARPMAPHVFELVVDSGVAPDLTYYLATHEAEYTAINGMSPARAGREIAKIEAKLATATPQKTEKKVTQAPAPARPVVASGITPTPSVYGRFEEF
jgi:hypothetical protein